MELCQLEDVQSEGNLSKSYPNAPFKPCTATWTFRTIHCERNGEKKLHGFKGPFPQSDEEPTIGAKNTLMVLLIG